MIILNDTEIKPTIFPDGTSQIWNIKPNLICAKNEIIWHFENEAELMHLAQLKMLLAAYGARASLSMPYLPYGRQDKPASNITSFALFTFAKIINTLCFERITFIDAHSFVATSIIERSTNIEPNQFISRAMELIGNDRLRLAYPDRGASERYGFMQGLGWGLPIYAEKKRDLHNGSITSLELKTEHELNGESVLIIDDLCDGGMTFKLMAEALIRAGAKEVHLYVTHGIFSKGVQTLRDSAIKRIFTKHGEVI